MKPPLTNVHGTFNCMSQQQLRKAAPTPAPRSAELYCMVHVPCRPLPWLLDATARRRGDRGSRGGAAPPQISLSPEINFWSRMEKIPSIVTPLGHTTLKPLMD